MGADPTLGYILKVKPIESTIIRCGCEKENKERLLLDFFYLKARVKSLLLVEMESTWREVNRFLFYFISVSFAVIPKQSLPILRSQRLTPVLSCKSFILLVLTFRSLIHFELIFVCCEKGVHRFAGYSCVSGSFAAKTNLFPIELSWQHC